MSHPLVSAATDLCQAVEGVDWSAAEVRDARERMSAAADVTPEVLAEACGVLVDRLKRSAVDDGDGAAQVALSAGALVERGAAAQPLARILTAHLPSVLISARRFADRCLAELPPPSDDGDQPTDDAFIRVDERDVSRAVFRELAPLDRPGGCALAYLREWVLPSIASLTRARAELLRAQGNPLLREAAQAMARSEAHWLPVLLDADVGEADADDMPQTIRMLRKAAGEELKSYGGPHAR